MSDNIQTNITGRLTPCLQKKIDKTTYLVEVHFSDTSTQNVKDKLKRVILQDLEHGKQGKPRKSDLDKNSCITVCATKGNNVLQYVRQSESGEFFLFHLGIDL